MMQPINEQTYSEEEVIAVLTAANLHANKTILKGATQLVNNQLSSNYIRYLNKGVVDLRQNTKPISPAYKKIKENLELSNAFAILKPCINRFIEYEFTISTTAKYGLGNCSELALHAFDYILNHADLDKIHAEIFFIEGKKNEADGDHVFLVINREINSDPLLPSTWGKNAWICDPWANKFYPAVEYLNQLQNYFYIFKKESNHQDYPKNYVEPFDHDVHKLVYFNCFLPLYCNTRFMKDLKLVLSNLLDDALLKITSEIANTMPILKKLKDELIELSTRLTRDHGKNNAKSIEIQHKINALHEATHKISQLIDELLKESTKNISYREKINLFIFSNTKATQIFNEAMFFSPESQAILFKHQNTLFGMFSNKNSKTQIELERILNECNLDIKINLPTAGPSDKIQQFLYDLGIILHRNYLHREHIKPFAKNPRHVKQLIDLLTKPQRGDYKDIGIQVIKILIDAKDHVSLGRSESTQLFYTNQLNNGLSALKTNEDDFRRQHQLFKPPTTHLLR